MEKSDQAFDHRLRSALENLEPDSTPDWQHMQSQLEEAYQDQAFDQQIRTILEKTQADAKELSWAHFEQKMRLQADRRRRILTARMVELVLVLMLFRTIDHIGFTHYLPVIHSPKPQSAAPASVPTTGNLLKVSDDLTSPAPASVASNAAALTGGLVPQEIDVATDRQIAVNAAMKLESLAQTSSNRGNAPYRAPRPAPVLHPASPLTMEVSGLRPTLRTAEELELPQDIPTLDAADDLEKTLPLPSLEGSGRIAVYNSGSRFLLSIFSGLLLNGVESPAFLDPAKHYRQAHTGLQAGLRVEFLHDEWILRSGLSYQNLRYEPNLSETLGNFDGGYYKILFREIQSQLISIPVGIERVLHSGKGDRLSAGFGLSITASLDNQYALDTITDLSGTSRQGISFDPATPSELLARVSKSSHRGLLQGGNFGSNAFASLILSVTYHRDLGNGWTVYSSLEGSKMLGELGFGPNSDKLFHASLSAGIGRKF
ncbi:MAG: hypothetical protein KBF37_11835 [Saprospiraceae bacterium]|jgi:hypothetical protein|nr:hypothetical protein [Saprospiraceae bacterium]MBP9210998.1 hypothetical protein [Saprospiraceae bacterium]MBV6474194.1 hypothetical protein [Saprospiraceae bacterium]